VWHFLKSVGGKSSRKSVVKKRGLSGIYQTLCGELKEKKKMAAHNVQFGASGGVARPTVLRTLQRLLPSERQ
jgi:glucokinase